MSDLQDARAVARVFATKVDLQGKRWWICPEGGFSCGAVSPDEIGEEWSIDVMDRHRELHHRNWR